MIVYMIRNKINKKVYIGQTVFSLNKRIKEHQNKSSSCPAIRNAIFKYGIENFEIKQLIQCKTQTELDTRETFCIRIFNSLSPNGYNLKKEGRGSGIYSEELKNKISKSVFKNHHTKKEGWISKKKKRFETSKGSPEFRKKLSEINKGKKMSAEACRKMSEAKKGRRLSEETILKIKLTKNKRREVNE